MLLLISTGVLGQAEEEWAVRVSLRGNAPEGKWETYTRRPSGLVFQQLTLRASGAEKTYPGLEQVNAAVEAVLRRQGLLPEGDYSPAQAPRLESGAWARLPEEDLRPAKEALVAYFRDPAVRADRTEAEGEGSYVAAAQAMLQERYPQRREEWENLSYWTIHTHVLASTMARGFLATQDPELRARFAREFRDWIVAYADYPYYRIDIPAGSGLAGWPYIWGDQWHMERTTRVLSAYFSFLTPDVASILSAPLPEWGGERFDFWFLKFALDQIVKAEGLVGGYRGGNHGWFQIQAAVCAALLLPEFKLADRALPHALQRAVEHCLDDNRLDGWHRESTLGYMGTYLAYEGGVLSVLDRHPDFLQAWSARTGVDLQPAIQAIRETLERQKQASQSILLPDYSVPNFGDGGPEKQDPPERPPEFVSNCLPGAGVYLLRSGWEAATDGREQVGLALNAMDQLGAHNNSDLLSILLYAYGRRLLAKPEVYRYENSDHWYKRCTQAANTTMPGDFADDSLAPDHFGAKEMYGEDGRSWGPWPGNTAATRFDQSGAGPTLGWRGAATNCARAVVWASGAEADFVDTFHDRYVRAVESPWPTGDQPFGPRMRRSLFFVRSRAGGVGPYVLLTDTFTNPEQEPLAGNYRDLDALFHLPVEDGWRTRGVPWRVDERTKSLRTTYPDANLTIAPADPEKVAIRQVKGLWTGSVKDSQNPPGASFGSAYSYIAPYVAYALPGHPAPVPSGMQFVLYPDRPGQTTDLRVTRLAVSPPADVSEAAAVQVEFPALGVRDLFLVSAAAGQRRSFESIVCDGAAAWMRLRGSQVLAAGLVNGTLLQRGAFSLQGARLQGQVISAEVQLHQGFVVNRLKLQGPPVPRWAEGHLISFWDDRDNFLTSYHLLQVLGPDEVLLSEARRQVSWAGLSQVDPAAGTLTMGAGGAELSPGQAVQLFQDGRAYIFRIAESRGAALKVTALDGSAADLSAFSGQLAPGFGHVYETLAPGGRYEISSLCGLSVVGP